MTPDQADLVIHHDLAPWNLVCGSIRGRSKGHGDVWLADAEYSRRHVESRRAALGSGSAPGS